MKHIDFWFLVIVISFASCDLGKGDEPVPYYVHVDDYTFTSGTAQGTARQQFRDIWLFVNDRYVGAYELPATVPVVEDFPIRLKFLPGIRRNGSQNEPTRFPFAEPYEITVDQPNHLVDTFRPEFRYASDVILPFIEDFDRFHFFNIEQDGNVETKISLSTAEEAFEGQNSGIINLTKENPVLAAWNDLTFKIPVTPNQVFLELHYKSDIPFYIGFIGLKGNQTENLINALVLPRKNWNKIYFDFADITNLSKSESYRLGVTAAFISDSVQTEQKILIDNIKVTYR
jgi:hypothetical protein